ncbi:MAG: RDD family protein [Betaproteobacteria bacterium]|nr:RDD family protein [Betaproteobacteria bacterium]
MLLTALILVAGFALLPWVSPDVARPTRELTIPALPMRAALLCTLLAGGGWYYVWSWTGGRRTLPMKTWRIRVATVAGENLALRVALVRYLAAWIGPALALSAYAGMRPLGAGAYALWLVSFNYLWAIVDRDRQFLHDRIAGTVLLRTAE